MRYAGIIKNDIAAGDGVCVSFFTQGCPHHCEGCHNPETWSFNGGKEFTNQTMEDIVKAIKANGVLRNFCIMGGEPLCEENEFLTYLVIQTIRNKFPHIKIYLWTGYTLKELYDLHSPKIDNILKLIDVLIDGRFDLSKRDITLPYRGSSNQRVLFRGIDF